MDASKHVEILLIEDSATARHPVGYWLDQGLRTPYTLHPAGSLAGGLRVIEEHPIIKRVFDTVAAYRGDEPQYDDNTILLVKVQ